MFYLLESGNPTGRRSAGLQKFVHNSQKFKDVLVRIFNDEDGMLKRLEESPVVGYVFRDEMVVHLVKEEVGCLWQFYPFRIDIKRMYVTIGANAFHNILHPECRPSLVGAKLQYGLRPQIL